jgi:subtilisin family serine protease
MKKVYGTLAALFFLISLPSFAQFDEVPSEDNHPYVEGELLVRYLSSTQSFDREVMVNDLGAVTIDKDYIVPNLELVQLQDGQSVEDAVEYFRQTPGVMYAVPNHLIKVDGGMFPPRELPEPNPVDPDPEYNDPMFSRSYGIRLIDSHKSWSAFTFGSRDVVVAVIDTGVDYTHEDLANNIWHNPNEIANNGIDDDNNGFIDDIYGWNFAEGNNNPYDDNKHGTHVAGTIGALANNGLGTIGVSPRVSIMACKFLNKDGWGSTDAAIRSVTYAVMNGAKVLNNSWGGGGFSQPMVEAIDVAKQAGVLFVAAAGNYNQDNDATPLYPASYTNDNIISVAATDYYDEKASWSNYGKTTVDLAAPGVSVFSTMPRSLYGTLSGTSMATPHVSGAAALLWAHKPTLNVQELKNLILTTAEPVSSMRGITVSGARLNIYNAMAFSILSP